MKKYVAISLVLGLAVGLSFPSVASAAAPKPPKSFCFVEGGGYFQFSLGTGKGVRSVDSLGVVKNVTVAGSISYPAVGMYGKVSGTGTVRVSGPDRFFFFTVTGGAPALGVGTEPYMLVSYWALVNLSTGIGAGKAIVVMSTGVTEIVGALDITTPCSGIVVLEEPAELLERLEQAPKSQAPFEELLEQLK